MKTQSITQGALGLALLVATTACGGGKAEQKGPPKGSIVARAARVDMTTPRFAGATVAVVLVVDNESNQAVTISRAAIEAKFAGPLSDPNKAAADDNPQPTGEAMSGSTVPRGDAKVAPGGSAEVPVELTLAYPTDGEAFLAFVKTGAHKLSVSGTVTTSAGDLQVESVTDFATPRLLEGQVKQPQVSSIDEGAAGDIMMDLVLHNPNPFPVKATGWNATFTVAGKELKKDDYGVGETVLPGSGVRYAESFKVDQENWGPDYKTILKKSQIPWVVEGTITVEGVSYPVKSEGVMQFHR